MFRARKLKPGHARRGRVIWTWLMLVLFLALVLMTWLLPDYRVRQMPGWIPVLEEGDAAWRQGDLYEAKRLYSTAGQIAAWREDWQGLLAAACRMTRINGEKGTYFRTHALLLRAVSAAEFRQSRVGIVAAANALAARGEHAAGTMALSRIRADWGNKGEEIWSGLFAEECAMNERN